MGDVLLPLILVCLGLALWRGAAWLRLPIDGFILALVLVLLAANLLPCQGEAALDRAEVALLFCGSQKSLISGVPIANALVSGALAGPLLLPIMLYHPIQLLVCTWIARSYLRAEERAELATVSAGPSIRSTV
jgi:sodium/bile acid cotransporter 7